ncbi:MAG: hypothetical protein C7B47_18025, partial [Sulfobacillus thermosulfidooxidans]
MCHKEHARHGPLTQAGAESALVRAGLGEQGPEFVKMAPMIEKVRGGVDDQSGERHRAVVGENEGDGVCDGWRKRRQ